MLVGTCHCGGAGWELDGEPGPITACNCTTCRRWGSLMAYDFLGERIRFTGTSRTYARVDPKIEFPFCPTCACVLGWRGLVQEDDGRTRAAVNVRLAPPEAVADLPIDHFDGLVTFDDLPRDGRCVRDLWF